MQAWVVGLGMEHKEALKMHQSFFENLVRLIKADLKQAGSIDTVEELEQTRALIKGNFNDVYDTEAVLWRFLLEQG
jgi:hypothetical protein